MPTVLHIDGLDMEPKRIEIKPGATAFEAIRELGGTVHVEHVPDEVFERTISTEAAAFIASYEREDASAILAVFWRYHSLEAEEFDTVDEAKRFLDSGEEYGSLAGEAIVDGDKIEVCD
jgi:hypothetical protein